MDVLKFFAFDHLLQLDQVRDDVSSLQGDGPKGLREEVSASSSWLQSVTIAIEVFITCGLALDFYLAKWDSSAGHLEAFVPQQFLGDVLTKLNNAVLVVEDIIRI